MAKLHPLEELISYLAGRSEDPSEHTLQFFDSEGKSVVRVRLKKRVVMYSSDSRESALDAAWRQILFSSIDMFMDDDLWNLYHSKLTAKMNKE